MTFRYLDKDGALSFWTNIKNFILSKIPTKTSELTNDSGYITNTDTCLHKSGGETFTGYKKVENINSGLIFKSTNYQAEIRLSGNEPYDVSIVSHKLSNDTYSYHTLMDRYGNVFPGIYRPRASNLTVYVSNAVSNNDGDGLTANTAFSYSALKNFLGAIRMQSGSSLGGTYSLTVNLIPTGTSYGTCRFDSTKMPYVKNLVIQTSTGIEGTPENYTTNCPDLLQLYISGNMDVTVRNIKCGEIGVYQGAKVTLTNFNAVGQVRADINGYVNVGGYLYVFYSPLSTAPRVSLFDASLDGHIRIENTNTTINFSEQIYYTSGVLRAINHGYLYANISRWKLLGIKPCVIVGSSTTVLTTCSTPANVSAKTVETGTTIGTSSVIGVTFSETNTADNPTLNVNGLGDWPIVADNNAVDIKHYLPFGVRIIFKRFGNTWKITNTKDLFQYIAGDCSMYVSGALGTTYNNGEFNFGDYIVSQSTSSTNTGIYNAVQYNINGTNIFDGIRTITQPWVYTATPSIKLTTTIGGTGYQDKGIKFTDTNSASIGYLYGSTLTSGSSAVGISASNIIDNATVSKGVRIILLNDGKSYFCPGNTNDTSLGSEYFTWKGVYANKYFLGNTEFGDIVTHNASEFITQHQSLADYATKQDLADLVNSAPSTLDTLNELASALGNDPNFATTVSTQIGTKANDNAVVHLTGDETINGTKTFSNRTIFSTTSANGELTLRQNAYDPATNGQSALSSTCNFNITARSVTNGGFAQIGFYGAPGFTTTRLNCRYYTGASESEETWVEYTVTGTSGSITGRSFKPSTNGLVDLGANANRWKSVYATNYYYGSDNVEFSNKFVTTDTAQEITNTKIFKDATTARKLTSVEAGNVIPSSDKLISDIWQDKNGKELGRIYYTKTSGGNTALVMRAGDWFSESEGVYSLNASGTNRRAELQLYSDSSGNCCIKPNGLFSAHIKPLNSSVYLGDSTKPFGRVYANSFQFCNAGLLPDTDVQTTEEHSIGFFGKNNTPLSYITFQKRPNLKDRIAVRIQTSSSSYKSYDFDATCFYPESNNSVDIGSTTNIFKNIYCNNYYKGTTAFGDIVTHNASEFLTEHQSLANYVTTNTNQSISGIKTFPTNIDLANTSTSQREYWALKFSKTDTNGTGASQLGVYQPSNSNDFVACLRLGNPRGDNKPTTGTGVNTGNCWSGIGVYYNYALNRGYPYAPSCNSWSDSSNADAELASTAWVRRYCETTKGFLTSHQSLANYVTTNTDQSISGNKTFGNGTLIVDNGIGSNVHGEIKLNGSRPGYIVADNASDGVFDNAGCGVSILLQDAGKPLHIGAYKTDSNGRVFVDNTNKNPVLSITSGLIRTSTLIPENDTGNSSFRILSQIDYANGNTSKLLDVRFVQYDNANATSAIYSNDDNKTSLGLSSKRWSNVYTTNAYITNLNLNGNAFDPTSVSGNIGDIVFASAYYSSITGTASLDLTVSGNTLYLACFDNNTLVIDSSASSLPGTWKFLGRGKPTTTSGNADTKRVGLWKRIA